jgi:hypothetical protein
MSAVTSVRNDMWDDELIARMRQANPVSASDVRGAFDSVVAHAALEEILRAPTGRVRRWWTMPAFRRGRALDGLDPIDVIGTANPVQIPTLAVSTSTAELDHRSALLESIISGTFEVSAADDGPIRLLAGRARRALAGVFGLRRTFDDAPLPGIGARLARRSRRAIVIPLTGALVVAGSAAAIVITTRHATLPTAAGFVSDSYGHGIDGTLVLGNNPVAECEQRWFSGAFGAPRKPALVACILPSLAVGVFPGRSDQVCASLHLSVALAPTKRYAAIGQLRLSLDESFDPNSACVGETAARAIVTRELGRLGLAGWKIEDAVPPTAVRKCASASIERAGIVTLVFLPHDLAAQPTPTTSSVSNSRTS